MRNLVNYNHSIIENIVMDMGLLNPKIEVTLHHYTRTNFDINGAINIYIVEVITDGNVLLSTIFENNNLVYPRFYAIVDKCIKDYKPNKVILKELNYLLGNKYRLVVADYNNNTLYNNDKFYQIEVEHMTHESADTSSRHWVDKDKLSTFKEVKAFKRFIDEYYYDEHDEEEYSKG